MESYSLFHLNEYIRRVLALNFREPLWIEAEIMQVNESRGTHYLELIEKEKNSDKVIAQASAVIWYRNHSFIKKKLGDVISDILRDGSQVKVKCQVDFHERYGYKLVIEDIDPSYTYGQLELKRQEVLRRLEKEGLMELNKGLAIPDVIQRVALISSQRAAGYQDFREQLAQNPYGYRYMIDVHDVAVQGVHVERDTVQAIEHITSAEQSYDIVAIVRGGGSKLDLSGYDSYEISKCIALCDIPFVIGIGHDIDISVVDQVSSLSLKTPTAVADFLVEHNAQFEGIVREIGKNIGIHGINQIHELRHSLLHLAGSVNSAARSTLQQQTYVLDNLRTSLANESLIQLNKHQALLEKYGVILDQVDPERVLQRGYTYLTRDGIQISDLSALMTDDEIRIHSTDNSVDAQIL
ncbi:MAG: exodeoxyribonuclease VII large subunit [Bacteroidota bacterium]